MPDLLPDIDLTNVGHVVWWNALNHGASFLDPNEVVQYDGVTDPTVYDNGITGHLKRDNRLRWRAKTDGWLVVYYDTSSETPSDTAIIDNYNQGNVDILRNVPAKELNALRQEASNTDEMDFSYTDVGLADYRDTDADIQAYEAYVYPPRGDEGNPPGENETWEPEQDVETTYGYKEGYEPEKLYLTGRSRMNVNGESVSPIMFNGRTLVPEQSDQGSSVGTAEAVADGWLDGPGEIHRMSGGKPTYWDSAVRAGVLALYE